MKSGPFKLKEKPKRWEVILMACVGIFTLFQMVKLKTQYDADLALHEKKVAKIESWSDAMFSTSERASASLAKVKDFDMAALSLVNANLKDWQTPLAKLAADWDLKRFRRCVEILPFVGNPEIAHGLIETMQKKQGVKLGQSSEDWNKELWKAEKSNNAPDQSYSDFKALLYRLIDPQYTEYFGCGEKTLIPLSMVRWSKDSASLAPHTVLGVGAISDSRDDEEIYGLTINGKSRAYKKQQLVDNRLFRDRLGEIEITGHYNPETETLTVFENSSSGVKINLAPSGFQYQSNTLVFDDRTKSLWLPSTGVPVVGALTGSGVKLKPGNSEHATWGAWKKAHPDSSLLHFEKP